MGEGDEDVGEDDGGVAVDCGDDDGPGGVPAPPEARGREPPSFSFFLGILPRWEKDSPSGPWSPWHGRGESTSEIGYVSLSLSVSAFWILPFHRFFYNRKSVTPIGLNFGHDLYPEISFLAAKEGLQPPYGVATRVQGTPDPLGRAPLPRGPLRHLLVLILLPIFHKYSKNILRPFLSRLDSI